MRTKTCDSERLASKAATFEAVAREFHATKREGWSATYSDKWLRLMERDVTVHGFRSSFKDWAEDSTNFANGVIDAFTNASA